jgi:hypothetical protein
LPPLQIHEFIKKQFGVVKSQEQIEVPGLKLEIRGEQSSTLERIKLSRSARVKALEKDGKFNRNMVKKDATNLNRSFGWHLNLGIIIICRHVRLQGLFWELINGDLFENCAHYRCLACCFSLEGSFVVLQVSEILPTS